MAKKVPVSINGVVGEVEEGTLLLDAAKQIGSPLAHLCFGNGLCSTCRVKVVAGEASLSNKETKERVSLDYHLCFDEKVRLACQCKVVAPESTSATPEMIEVVAPKPFSYLAFGKKKPS